MGLTNNLALALQATNSNPGTWGSNLNANVITLLDNALGATNIANVAGNTNVTLTTSQAGNLIHDLSGVLTGNIQYIFPASTGRIVIINNATTGAFTVTVLTSGGTGVVVPQATTQIVGIDSSTNTASLLASAANIGALLKSNNLSDVPIPATALSNLGGASLSGSNTYIGTNAFSTATALTMAAGDNSSNIATDAYAQSISGTKRSFANLQSTYASTTTFTVKVDEACLENSSGNVVKVASSSTITNTITNSGANGLDTGSLSTNTNYNCFLIYNSTTTTLACIISLAAPNTGPTLPSGYTFWAWYGTIALDGSSHIYSFKQFGSRMIFWVGGGNLSALPVFASGSAGNVGTPTFVSFSNIAYTTSNAPLKSIGVLASTSAGSTILVAPNASYGITAGNECPINNQIPGSNSPVSMQAWITPETSSFYWASAGSTCYAQCIGYEYNR